MLTHPLKDGLAPQERGLRTPGNDVLDSSIMAKDKRSRLRERIEDRKKALKADRDALKKLDAADRAQAQAKSRKLADRRRFLIGKIFLRYFTDGTRADTGDTHFRTAVVGVLRAGLESGPVVEADRLAL